MDVVTNAKPDNTLGFILTDGPVFAFDNQAITSKRRNIKVRVPADMGKHTVMAFQGARKYLGQEFLAAAEANPSYKETNSVPALMLQEDRADIVISQPDVFRYALSEQARKLSRQPDYDAFTYQRFLPATNKYWVGFRDAAMRDRFQAGLAAIYKSGEIDRIAQRYADRFGTTRSLIAELDCRYQHREAVDCAGREAGARGVPRVLMGIARPPFVMEETGSGISIDLFTEAMKRIGVRFRSSHVTNDRMVRDLQDGLADVAVELQKISPDYYYSDAFVTYNNVVASREAAGLNFVRWSDLARRDVCAWQQAERDLGSDFSRARATFQTYNEFGVQSAQVRGFALGRCEVVVIDQSLLAWHLRELRDREPGLHPPALADLRMVPVPGKAGLDWFVGFRDKTLRNRFNDALRAMRADGTYTRIVERYIPAESAKPAARP